MEDNLTALSIAEQNLISKAILLLINQYPELPSGVKASWQYVDDKNPLAVFSQQGAVKLVEYLCMPGEDVFDGQFPFFILYRCKPTSVAQRMSKQNILDGLGEWIEHQEYPALTGGRTITAIERTTTSSLVGRLEDGSEEYQCNFNLTYEKR